MTWGSAFRWVASSFGFWPGALQLIRPAGPATLVEGQHTVAHRLQAYRPDPRGLRAAGTVVDRRQRQQPAALTGIPARPVQPTQVIGPEVLAQRHGSGYGEPSRPAPSNHTRRTG
jgi:hypothetical protein